MGSLWAQDLTPRDKVLTRRAPFQAAMTFYGTCLREEKIARKNIIEHLNTAVVEYRGVQKSWVEKDGTIKYQFKVDLFKVTQRNNLIPLKVLEKCQKFVLKPQIYDNDIILTFFQITDEPGAYRVRFLSSAQFTGVPKMIVKGKVRRYYHDLYRWEFLRFGKKKILEFIPNAWEKLGYEPVEGLQWGWQKKGKRKAMKRRRAN